MVQAFLPGIAMCFILFFPESPRWLIAHNRRDEALQVFAKYHGDGDVNAPIVQLQYREVIEQMEMYKNENPWWDFRELFNTKAARYRIAVVIAMAFFGQWSGNNVVSYFMVGPTSRSAVPALTQGEQPQMVKQAGITNPNTQLLINAINPIFSMLGAIYGATLLDKLGRRKTLLGGLGGGLFAYVLLTAFTASSKTHKDLSYGVIVSIYLFGISFAWGKSALFQSACGLPTANNKFFLRMDSTPDPLRGRVPRKPHPSKGLRPQLPLPEHCVGHQHIRDFSWHSRDWLEVVPCLHRLDLY
jgi:hypothetical protein